MTLFFVTLLVQTAFADIFQIQVTSPTKGSAWNLGNTYTIHWDTMDTSGKIDKYYWVKVLLFPQGQPGQVTLITESPFNSDSINLSWTVPSNIPSGNYVIRVQEHDTNKYGDSAPFTISPAPMSKFFPMMIWLGSNHRG